MPGDQAIWWVMNDKGNTHTKFPGGLPIGLEIQVTAFAYATSDEINNMTFYKYKLINRGNNDLSNMYFGQWADADLGNPADDYVGCDVNRNLGYTYNADNNDEGSWGYGLAPPAVGIDMLSNNFGPNGQMIPMSSFMYFTNSSPAGQDDPANATELYRYLRGIWGDGIPLTYAGTGHTPGSTDTADYAFPGTTDPLGRPEWSEVTESNPAGDRRMIQSTGPFEFAPGSIKEITFGVVWARGTNYLESVQKVMEASDKAQQLADNNFAIAGHGCNSPLTGISHQDGSRMVIYPNPSDSKTTLTFGVQTPQLFDVSICDVNGRVVCSARVFDDQYIIEKGDLKAGIYLVNIKGEKETMQRKLVFY